MHDMESGIPNDPGTCWFNLQGLMMKYGVCMSLTYCFFPIVSKIQYVLCKGYYRLPIFRLEDTIYNYSSSMLQGLPWHTPAAGGSEIEARDRK